MFCHNCGKDCGEFRFCPHCGTQIQSTTAKVSQKVQKPQESRETARAAGLPCPHCGGTKLEGKCCAFCGIQLIPDVPQTVEQVSTNIPCGVYNGVTSSLALYETECVVCNRASLFKRCETRIPYNKLTYVVYVRKVSGLSFLVFRWEENKNLPWEKYRKDPTTVTMSQTPRTLFYSSDVSKKVEEVNNDTLLFHIYYMLKAIAPQATQFNAITDPVDVPELDAWSAKMDLESYFEMYAPYRDQAIKAMCERTGAPEKVAKELINRIFDARQKEIYSAEPVAAMRDLNQIVEEKKRREKLAKERVKEADEQRKRDALLYELNQRNAD